DVVRRQDVALLAVEVVEQGDAAVAVRVVLDRRDLRLEVVLVPLEVDDAVLLLVAAAAMASGLAALVVAAAGVVLGREQRLLRRRLGDVGEVGDGLEPASGARGLAFANGHGSVVRAQAWNSSMVLPGARVT